MVYMNRSKCNVLERILTFPVAMPLVITSNKFVFIIWNAFAVLLCGKCIIWGGDFNISCGKINILIGYFNM